MKYTGGVKHQSDFNVQGYSASTAATASRSAAFARSSASA
jgi:hypothetical protein